jgi:predicted dinucleotide-binding enzyme
MNIAIIGSGNVGGALAQQWIKSGHHVRIGAKFPLSDKNLQLAQRIGEERFSAIPDAVAQADIVLIATPPTAIFDILAQTGSLDNKLLIDATNAVRAKPEPFETVYHALSAQTKAKVVKCFNSTGFENMLNPEYNGVKIDMFMAGDDPEAKQTVQQLALDAGFATCWDFGKADKVQLLEQFALAWINLAIMQGHGRDIAIKLIRR